ncbi:MAG TPA: bifunctional methylenetetrahydrofolate dehydrogenase/methenyltetrahydrofolate cyclohydrolase FolD, partial [Devosiaceae bacterium]|nr:bifunctional methylenetetrahydrofolate dehydrogenase/methenyltetrahydrofolate cyclohydrolase FolD [Devosiaceae bacterium]
RARVAGHVARLQAEHDFTPGLAVVIVGEDPASQLYVRNKARQSEEVGINSFHYALPADAPEAQLLGLVSELDARYDIDGILVQMPVPDQIDPAKVIEAIDPAKDVDCFTPVNVGKLAIGLPALVPCTPLGCLMLLREALGSLEGQHAVIVGRSNLVGKPMAQLLLRDDCTVTIAHSRTRDLPELCKTADILVAAAGRPEMIRGGWIKPDATVIDVGINRLDAPEKGAGKTRLVGDVAFDEAVAVAGAITPVPGGVGPMTIACLLANTVTAASMRRGIAPPDDLTP